MTLWFCCVYSGEFTLGLFLEVPEFFQAEKKQTYISHIKVEQTRVDGVTVLLENKAVVTSVF